VDDAASKKMLAFFEQEYIALRSVERIIAEKAHDLTRKLAIKHADAIHVATACISNVRVLHTWDEGHAQAQRFGGDRGAYQEAA